MTAGTRSASDLPSDTEPAWFEKWFGVDYLSIYPHRDGREADVAVDFIRKRTAGKQIERVLDLACGAGRHSRALGRHWWTTGLDLSETLLVIARREATEECYVRGDMRILPFRAASFSLVVNLFTSFGYFGDDESHAQVLREVSMVTAAGGTFVLDYLNAEQVVQTLKPTDVRVVNGETIEQRRAITDNGRFVEKTITLVGKNKSFVETVRLFSRSDLESMLGAAGFSVEEVIGDYTGAPWTPASERTMLLSVKR